uniref:Uncharacterized protein n=1 Tax=Odontella aurita TaxID=265563 RepID=A0A7S4INF3_9STRA
MDPPSNNPASSLFGAPSTIVFQEIATLAEPAVVVVRQHPVGLDELGPFRPGRSSSSSSSSSSLRVAGKDVRRSDCMALVLFVARSADDGGIAKYNNALPEAVARLSVRGE